MQEVVGQSSFSVESSSRFQILKQPIHQVSPQPQGIDLEGKDFDSDSSEAECQMPLLTMDISRLEFLKPEYLSELGRDTLGNIVLSALRIHAENSSIRGLVMLVGEGRDDGTGLIKILRSQSPEETPKDRTQLSLTRFDLLTHNIRTEWIDMGNRRFEDVEKDLRERSSETPCETLVGIFRFID